MNTDPNEWFCYGCNSSNWEARFCWRCGRSRSIGSDRDRWHPNQNLRRPLISRIAQVIITVGKGMLP